VRTARDAIRGALKELKLPNDFPAETRFRRSGRLFPIVDAMPTLIPIGARTSFVKCDE